jgi:4-amino-4-deoxy-L-arabinose transferase-like glycosyltransferase
MLPLLIFGAALVFFLLFNASIPITDPVESNYALTAKEMFLSGDWLSPSIYGQFWYDKPAMIYWMIAASFKLFGINEFAARLPSAVFSAASVAYIYHFAGKLFANRRIGLYAAVVLATSLEYWVLAKMVITDAVLFFFTSVSLGALYFSLEARGKYWYVWAYAAAGMAVLTKGPIGILLPGLMILLYILITNRWHHFSRLHIFPGLVIFFVVSAPWYVAMYKIHGNAFIDTFLGLHNYLRATVSEHPKDNVFYYYLVLFPVSLLPWTGVLIRSFKNWKCQHYPLLIVWIGTFIVFYTLMATKYPTYVFPATFPAAVMIAHTLDKMRHSPSRSWLWLTGPALLLVAIFCAGGTILPNGNGNIIYLLSALAVLVLLWLGIKRSGPKLIAVVAITVVAMSLGLIYQHLIPMAGERSAKAVSQMLPAAGADVAALGEYPTSAVFYSGYLMSRLESNGDTRASGVWAGKYTMPTEAFDAFVKRTADNPESYIIVTGLRQPVIKGFHPIYATDKTILYKRGD